MKRVGIIFLLIALFIIGCQSDGTSLPGKIVTKEFAEKEFGSVLNSIKVSNTIFEDAFKISERVLIVGISPDKSDTLKTDQLFIRNNKSNVIYPMGAKYAKGAPFTMYGIDKIQLVIAEGKSSTSDVQYRENGKITIQNGDMVLDYGSNCPPHCVD